MVLLHASRLNAAAIIEPRDLRQVSLPLMPKKSRSVRQHGGRAMPMSKTSRRKRKHHAMKLAEAARLRLSLLKMS